MQTCKETSSETGHFLKLFLSPLEWFLYSAEICAVLVAYININ